MPEWGSINHSSYALIANTVLIVRIPGWKIIYCTDIKAFCPSCRILRSRSRSFASDIDCSQSTPFEKCLRLMYTYTIHHHYLSSHEFVCVSCSYYSESRAHQWAHSYTRYSETHDHEKHFRIRDRRIPHVVQDRVVDENFAFRRGSNHRHGSSIGSIVARRRYDNSSDHRTASGELTDRAQHPLWYLFAWLACWYVCSLKCETKVKATCWKWAIGKCQGKWELISQGTAEVRTDAYEKF